MKIRSDFVTNSSSSSFVLARKSQLNEAQKEKIIQFVEKELLGTKVLTPKSTKAEIEEVFEDDWSFQDRKTQNEVRKALKSGKSVYSGCVSYEDAEYDYAKIFANIWRIMEENSQDDFQPIDTDLSY